MISIRLAAVSDVSVVVPLFEMYRQFYRQPSDPHGATTYLQSRLERGQATVFLAFKAQRAVGFALPYDTWSSVAMKPLTILNDLYTVETARGRGVATALIRESQRYARERGSIYLRLRTAHDNEVAQRLYKGVGFVRDDVYWTYNLKPALPNEE